MGIDRKKQRQDTSFKEGITRFGALMEVLQRKEQKTTRKFQTRMILRMRISQPEMEESEGRHDLRRKMSHFHLNTLSLGCQPALDRAECLAHASQGEVRTGQLVSREQALLTSSWGWLWESPLPKV